MYSYGQAEAARLQTLRRDVDRILAKAGTAAEPAENECMPPSAPVSGEEQPLLRCLPSKGHEEGAPRPTEGPARLSLKRKGPGGTRACCEDEPAEDVASNPPHRFRSADHTLCRQVHAAVAGVLQQAVASKEQAWKRRNFLGKKASLYAPSPPNTLLRTSELNDFICWAQSTVPLSAWATPQGLR